MRSVCHQEDSRPHIPSLPALLPALDTQYGASVQPVRPGPHLPCSSTTRFQATRLLSTFLSENSSVVSI